MRDRGVLAAGMKADLNLIDFDNLRLHPPEMVFDLPADGRRFVQRVDGYKYTIVSGEVTYEDRDQQAPCRAKSCAAPALMLAHLLETM